MEKITFYFRKGTTWRFFIILLPHTHNHVDCTYGLTGLRKEKHMKLGELCCGWLMKVRGSESRFKIKKSITFSQINKSTYIWIAYVQFFIAILSYKYYWYKIQYIYTWSGKFWVGLLLTLTELFLAPIEYMSGAKFPKNSVSKGSGRQWFSRFCFMHLKNEIMTHWRRVWIETFL